MGVSRASDASEGKCTGSVSPYGDLQKTSGQIFKLFTVTDSLLVPGSNGTCYKILSSIHFHLQSSSCHHVSIHCVFTLFALS